MDKKFLKRLDKARGFAGVPFKITSGYRCQEYQRELKRRGFETANGVSPHELGVAVDIACPDGEARFKILFACYKAGITRFGIGKSFIHADMDKGRRQLYVWVYKHRN
jgi:uncharacterized protein YcbK (DUF882 family)